MKIVAANYYHTVHLFGEKNVQLLQNQSAQLG